MKLFKVGDVVKFKSPTSENACYFEKGLKNLTINAIGNTSYYVYESDKSGLWWVKEDELELQQKSLKQIMGETK